MKKLLFFLSFFLCIASPIKSEQLKQSTWQRRKQQTVNVLTSKPMIAVYGVLIGGATTTLVLFDALNNMKKVIDKTSEEKQKLMNDHLDAINTKTMEHKDELDKKSQALDNLRKGVNVYRKIMLEEKSIVDLLQKLVDATKGSITFDKNSSTLYMSGQSVEAVQNLQIIKEHLIAYNSFLSLFNNKPIKFSEISKNGLAGIKFENLADTQVKEQGLYSTAGTSTFSVRGKEIEEGIEQRGSLNNYIVTRLAPCVKHNYDIGASKIWLEADGTQSADIILKQIKRDLDIYNAYLMMQNKPTYAYSCIYNKDSLVKIEFISDILKK